MIDTKKIREENDSRYEGATRQEEIRELCDEVDRITKSYRVAHNLYVDETLPQKKTKSQCSIRDGKVYETKKPSRKRD